MKRLGLGLFLVGLALAQEGERCTNMANDPAKRCHCPEMVAEAQERDRKAGRQEREHCEIIRSPEHYNSNDKRRCRTSCKPEKCGCGDGVCKPHDYTDETALMLERLIRETK